MNTQRHEWGLAKTIIRRLCIVAIAAGVALAPTLKCTAGSVVAFRDCYWGKCHVPPDAKNVEVFAAGKYLDEAHNLALRADGMVVAWEHNSYGQASVPTSVGNTIAVAAGGFHSLTLDQSGVVTAGTEPFHYLWQCNPTNGNR
jgi:hypothetical protein